MLTSWPFCPRCGTILSAPSSEKAEDTIKCDFCSFDCQFTDFNITPVVFPSAIFGVLKALLIAFSHYQ